jgi:hypothetical protein
MKQLQAVEPIAILELFFTPALMDQIMINTNAHALTKITERQHVGTRK